MPKLILTDGTIRPVDYNTAAKILDVLNGNKEPENEEQAKFICTVANVEFEKPKRTNSYRRAATGHDTEMDNILKNPKLRGFEKLRAVVERIQQRARV